MTSRERVNAVLNHQLPDYLPNCWGGCETAGLHILAYQELVAALGLPQRPSHVDTFMFNAVMDEDVLLAMQGGSAPDCIAHDVHASPARPRGLEAHSALRH